MRLQRAKQPEIVFGVLEIVLRQDPIAGGAGVARQLLIAFEDVLGVATHLHVVGTVGLERAIGVLLRLAPAAAVAASAAAIATALTLHPLEISHMSESVRIFPRRSRRSGLRPARSGPPVLRRGLLGVSGPGLVDEVDPRLPGRVRPAWERANLRRRRIGVETKRV